MGNVPCPKGNRTSLILRQPNYSEAAKKRHEIKMLCGFRTKVAFFQHCNTLCWRDSRRRRKPSEFYRVEIFLEIIMSSEEQRPGRPLMPSSLPVEIPLRKYPIVHTRSPEEAREALSRVADLRAFDLPQGAQGFLAELNY